MNKRQREALLDCALNVEALERASRLWGRELLSLANAEVENVSVGESAIGEGSSSIMSSFSRAGGTLVRRDMGEEWQGYLAGQYGKGTPREEFGEDD